MKIEYILCGSGKITLPVINHTWLGDMFAHHVMYEAQKIVAALAKAGYSSFTLYEGTDGNGHKPIARYNVEMPEPVVNCVSFVE